ncbi:MAG: hypothetical protein GAK30_01545 [Paracidovorax wautersii]|uniref:Uncharacterized protein n=1 Tax=Paracidovorax wautersii TaxID=1177982 RepID=A0A7V8FPP6_9BURK|nr:MAG: hypothetical protein GAK30_01545 [Paracidovorax wautersii]
MTWLYLPRAQPSPPSNSAPASACSASAPGLHSDFSATTSAPFATWSGKPLQPRNLSRSWKREPLLQRLSGLTCSPSTAQRGADAWIGSLQASRARTSPSPAAVLGLTANAPASSSTSSTSPTLAVRQASFWRTSQPSLLPPPPLWTKPKGHSKKEPPPASWENWPTAGGTRNGSIYPRPTWEPAMGESAGFASPGAWPTPDTGGERINRSPSPGAASRPTIALAAKQWQTPAAADAKRQGNYGRGQGNPTFAEQARTWPTPRATDGTKGGPNQAGSRGDLMLPSAAAQWPTPTMSDSEQAGGKGCIDSGKRGHSLHSMAGEWPTPASRDYRTPNSQNSQANRNHTGGEQLPNYVEHHFSHPVRSTLDGRPLSPTGRTLPRRLNPAFACWLMGWPIWWTNPALTSSARSEMASYHSRLQQHLSNFFAVPARIERAAA